MPLKLQELQVDIAKYAESFVKKLEKWKDRAICLISRVLKALLDQLLSDSRMFD